MKTVWAVSARPGPARAKQSARKRKIPDLFMPFIFTIPGRKVERASDWRKKTANPVNSFSFIGFAYSALFRMRRIVASFFEGKRTEKQISFCQ
ncbi:MAG TPA: hypothetical protein VJU77_19570 [Chthoniobacterales bacterium]|nr:hypothetical protein [Chthoniobacterales bacterium]